MIRDRADQPAVDTKVKRSSPGYIGMANEHYTGSTIGLMRTRNICIRLSQREDNAEPNDAQDAVAKLCDKCDP